MERDIQNMEIEIEALIHSLCQSGKMKKEYENVRGMITHGLLNKIIDFIQRNAIHYPRGGYFLSYYSSTEMTYTISERDMKALKQYRTYLKQ